MNSPVALESYDNSWYNPGRSFAWRAFWMFVGQPLFRSPLLPSSALRRSLLRCFGAKVGKGVVIHSEVVVKYPWHLTVGDHSWIGERAWIDCLTTVRMGASVCVSQGAYLCTGNHDWSDRAFGLRLGPIHLGNGSWVGARSTLLPGTELATGAIVTAGSVVAGYVPPLEVFGGNPAVFVRKRRMKTADTADTTAENKVLERTAR